MGLSGMDADAIIARKPPLPRLRLVSQGSKGRAYYTTRAAQAFVLQATPASRERGSSSGPSASGGEGAPWWCCSDSNNLLTRSVP